MILDARWFTSQKVGDIHFTQTVDADFSADQFEKTRHGAEGDALQTANVRYETDDLSTGAGDGNDDLIHRAMFQGAPQIGQSADHRYAMHLVPLFSQVIVQVANRTQAKLPVLLHFPHHQRACIAGADDQNVASFPGRILFISRTTFCQQPKREAQTTNPHHGDEPIDRQDPTGKVKDTGVMDPDDVERQHDG